MANLPPEPAAVPLQAACWISAAKWEAVLSGRRLEFLLGSPERDGTVYRLELTADPAGGVALALWGPLPQPAPTDGGLPPGRRGHPHGS